LSENPHSILQETFGYDNFLENQQEIIQTVLAKRDALVIMPTGSGKSICYQIPALIFDGLTVVISPLISLMNDQVTELKENGAKVKKLNSQLDRYKYRDNINQIKNGEVDLLYLAPETLKMQRTINLLQTIQVDCFAVDEAHCVSEWGHDFRPEYREIAEIRNQFENASMIALTATATPHVQDDISNCLDLENEKKFVSSFDRDNLYLDIQSKENPLQKTLDLINKFPEESGIVYCFSRKQVDQLATELQEEGFKARPYHAGLSNQMREKNQESFNKDDINIIVATVAFGMGIDKPDIRYIVHYDLPKNIETYYQQIGRAGRDGRNSYCLLLFGYNDIAKIKYILKQKEGKQKKIGYQHLDSIINLCETNQCRRIPLLNYFGEEYNRAGCGMCDNCETDGKDLQDLTKPAQKFMSCMVRTDELYGMNHIIKILRGSRSKKVLNKNHHKLSTYNIGQEYSKQGWKSIAKQLIQNNCINRDINYGSLKLRKRGWKILKQKDKFFGEIDDSKQNVKEIQNDDYDSTLFKKLRTLRKKIADKADIPPYTIFKDKTLVELAHYYPQSKDSFKNIYGIGDQKAKKYGPKFLPIIKEYARKNNKPDKTKKQTSRSGHSNSQKRRYQEVGERFNNGESITELQNSYNVKKRTILKNLYKYVQDDNQLTGNFSQISGCCTNEISEVLEAFDSIGHELLKPVYQYFDGKISYSDLRLIRLEFLKRSNKSK